MPMGDPKMSAEDHPASSERAITVAFVGGVLTAGTIALAFFVFLGARVGFGTIWERIGFGSGGAALEMPADLIAELVALDAVVDNADNPTGARRHDTVLVGPHEEFIFALRPNVSVDGYQLRSAEPLNLDPPVVYIRSGSALSPALRAYLDENTRVSYSYTTNADGFRRTLPEVDAKRKILMVGDSGLFGVGVGDEDTIASKLQQLVGAEYRVVNTGVGGYAAENAFWVADALSQRDDFSLLVYVAHENDFEEPRNRSNPDKARGFLAEFATLRDRFPEGIVVALITHLEHTSEDVLLSAGWKNRDRIDTAIGLRQAFPALAREAGFAFVDFSDVVDRFREQEQSIFAPWALYVDHAHLSPRATRLLAERIHAAIPEAATMRAEARAR